MRILPLLLVVSQAMFGSTVLSDPEHHFFAHWDDMVFGATILGIISHAVNSFPPSENKYINWLLGVIQYAVGQRQKALSTLPNQNQNPNGR